MLVVTGGEAMYADVGHFGATPIRAELVRRGLSGAARSTISARAPIFSTGAPVAGGKLFYSPRAAAAAVSDGPAGDRRDGHRFAGADFRRLLAGVAGDPARPVSAARHSATPTTRTRVRSIFRSSTGRCSSAAWRSSSAFGSSSALAAAYGLAVSGVMVITSVAMVPIARHTGNGARRRPRSCGAPLLAVNVAFLVACSLKLLEGGYVPLSVGAVAFAVMATWRWGRKATFAAYTAKSTMTMAELVELHRASRTYSWSAMRSSWRRRPVADRRPTARRR